MRKSERWMQSHPILRLANLERKKQEAVMVARLLPGYASKTPKEILTYGDLALKLCIARERAFREAHMVYFNPTWHQLLRNALWKVFYSWPFMQGRIYRDRGRQWARKRKGD